MKPLVLLPAFLLFVLILHPAFAGSATWNLNPTDNLWHTAANWTPATVPNGESDTASFGLSNMTTVRISKYAQGKDGLVTTLDKLVFEEGASSYTIKVVPGGVYGVFFEVVGEGVINNSLHRRSQYVSGELQRRRRQRSHPHGRAVVVISVGAQDACMQVSNDSSFSNWLALRKSSRLRWQL